MKTLHLFRTEPNELVRWLVNGISPSGEDKDSSLYEDQIDYTQLLKDIFENERIISWW